MGKHIFQPLPDKPDHPALERKILEVGADNVAAFIAEPMMGSSGGAVPPVKEYWPRIREICTKYDVLLIADEVMTGFGRTGRRFAGLVFAHQRFVSFGQMVFDLELIAKATDAEYWENCIEQLPL